jgi:two-component sensor histidine kinase
VKNNLQTISSLLRLQARRLDPGEAQQALKEAERRVRSIALVHEILSRDPGEEVPFSEIVVSLVHMAEDSVVGPAEIEIRVNGDLGDVTAVIATPLAVVIAELLQNAVEHGFPTTDVEGSDSIESETPAIVGRVDLVLEHDSTALQIAVRDDGVGLPPGFDLDATTSLGLSIVRDLITSQLGGTMAMASDSTGTTIDIRIALDSADPDHAW